MFLFPRWWILAARNRERFGCSHGLELVSVDSIHEILRKPGKLSWGPVYDVCAF